jgi:biopolymer transport protein ExbB
MLPLLFKGGPMMWPLLALSLVSLTVVLERLFFVVRVKALRQAGKIDEIFSAVEALDFDRALRAGSGSTDFVARALTAALRERDRSLSSAFLRAAGAELRNFNRGLSVLDTAITLAPLMGLLGTVTGMIRAFGFLGSSELSAPTAITGGIAEALIATAFGLGIAIVSLIPFNFLNARLEQARHEIEDAGTRMELLLRAEER